MNLKKIILPVVILMMSALAAWALVRTRPEVETQEVEILAPLVRAMTVERRPARLDVLAQGTVLPRTETTLIPQVAGEVTTVSPSFETGGFFRRGEGLVTLDPRDYEVAVRRARAQVVQAELQVAREEAEAEVAIEEWNTLDEGGEPSPLVLREPQLAQARAALAAAAAELDKAELDLERTRIRAPFDGRVRTKLVDLGQYVTPGTRLATIHATDYAEIRLPVPDDQLVFLDLPFTYRNASAAAGPEVVLRARFGQDVHAWSGHIVRTEGELDSKSRMLNLVARVESPYHRAAEDPDRPPLAVGLFVEAEIRGRVADGVVTLPRAALRPGGRGTGRSDQVLVVDAEDRLRFRDVDVLRLRAEEALIGSGLEDGERVCVSPLDIVTDGMRVRTVDAAEEGEEES